MEQGRDKFEEYVKMLVDNSEGQSYDNIVMHVQMALIKKAISEQRTISRAAEKLGILRTRLHNLLIRYGLHTPKKIGVRKTHSLDC